MVQDIPWRAWAAVTFIALALALAAPVVARADTDYPCLSRCVSGGGVGTECLARCSYTPAPVEAPSQSDGPRQFETPKPYDGVLVNDLSATGTTLSRGAQPAPGVQHIGPATDYQCMRACVETGSQSAYCRQSCSH